MTSCNDDSLNVAIIVIYLLNLLFTLLNAYLYLWKLSKYRFMPFVLLYVGMASLCCLVIAYSAQCITPGSRINTSESAWVYYFVNMKTTSMVSMIGFSGLIIDLLLMLRLMRQSQEAYREARETLTSVRNSRRISTGTSHQSSDLNIPV